VTVCEIVGQLICKCFGKEVHSSNLVLKLALTTDDPGCSLFTSKTLTIPCFCKALNMLKAVGVSKQWHGGKQTRHGGGQWHYSKHCSEWTQRGVLIVSFTLAYKCKRTSQRLKQINAAERIRRACGLYSAINADRGMVRRTNK